jgi:hypothetical protein
MNVGKLKKILADLPDNIEVVVPGSDHSYTKVWTAAKTKAAWSKEYEVMSEYWGDENLSPTEVAIEVFVIN